MRYMFALSAMGVAGAVLAAILMVGLASKDVHAASPLDVDCDLLAATNESVNVFLDGEGIQFDNLGDLFSSAIQDEAVFQQLSDLILFFSGGAIDFDSASQAISTNAKCGLTPSLIDNIRD
ncbi:MAG: hypothetical protein IIC86_08935 [Chloroflexi bacterium]|nr:hypothetical protein [Chloroflexota bacterium]